MDQRLSLITLGVTDMDRAAAFYDALGWTRVVTDDAGIVAYDLIAQTLGLYPLDKMAEDIGLPVEALGRGGSTLGYNTQDRAEVDAVMAAAQAAGGKILKPATEVFWGGYHGFFADPDAHIWEVAHNPFSPLGPGGAFQWNGAG